MENHLRPVPKSSDTPAERPTTKRAPQRPRTTKALPTDRLKFSVQQDALRAIAIASDYGKRAVGSEDIAPRIGVAPATAGLNNAFFMECGLITRESKGKYKPTGATSKFARDHSFDPKRAGLLLAEPLKQSWAFREVQQQLAMESPSPARMVEVLAHAAGATADHEPQLLTILAWLEYAGLISTKNGNIETTDRAATVPAPKPDGKPGDESKAPADPTVPKPTKSEDGQRPSRGEPVLSFSFDFALTADDLKGLSPEQIQAVFEAVGKVVAIKANT